MFDKILIANRGEIACRVIRTARRLGIKTVAVYSDADATAQHVVQADQAVRIGPAPSADSYLRGEVIIQAALATGAQAIHPGYGFLSENPDFVEAVTAAGLVFIGPSAAAIRAMGLKDAAKTLMERAGVPVVPGYHGATQDAAHLAQMAAKVGFPVLIKAVAGGGGKGMRAAHSPQEFAAALASARAEAQAAFGNPDVLIEKLILNPRHIEVQVFGDGQEAVHLFERDCSLQRRHQKVIEEAPAPGMTPELRAQIGAAAVRAAKAIGYSGAGTIEFIVDGQTFDFWFMEMNTRLQVEHPVSEAITGVDLVEWQLRVAAGQPLPATQDDLTFTGHAIEARLYAEDVPAGFLPAIGQLSHLLFPDSVRADSGVVAGDTISPWYDPMIAKVIVHAPDRPAALRKIADGLAQVQVAGAVTNIGFLGALVRHPDFVAGAVDTGLIGRSIATLTDMPPPTPSEQAAAVLVASGLIQQTAHEGFHLWTAHPQSVTLRHLAEDLTFRVETATGRRVITTPDWRAEVLRLGEGWWCDGAPLPQALRHGDQITVFGQTPRLFEVADPLGKQSKDQASDVILTPMPGLVRAVDVVVGAAVSAGQRLAVLEAMKMEHGLVAPRDGIVQAIHSAVGDQVAAGIAIVTLEPVAQDEV